MAKGKEAKRAKKDKKKEAAPVEKKEEVAGAPVESKSPEKGLKEGEEPLPEDELKETKKAKKEKRSQKERPKSKKKHMKVQIWKLYDGGKAKNENCPRCGPGTFIASYENRKYCGRCGWSEIKKDVKQVNA